MIELLINMGFGWSDGNSQKPRWSGGDEVPMHERMRQPVVEHSPPAVMNHTRSNDHRDLGGSIFHIEIAA